MCVLGSLQLLSETFLILRSIKQGIIMNVLLVFQVKYPLYLSHFNDT